MSIDPDDLKMDALIITLLVISAIAVMTIGWLGLICSIVGYCIGRLFVYFVMSNA